MTADDLIEFGMIPEFVGRLPVLPRSTRSTRTRSPHPDRAAKRPGPAYQKLFEMEGPSSSSTSKACTKSPDGHGAQHRRPRPAQHRRGLMTDIMFELPDMEEKGKYVVTDAVVRREEPLFDKKIPYKKRKR